MLRAGKARVMKEMNLSLGLDLIRKHGPATRPHLAKLAGLSLPTVGAVVEELLARGLVKETGRGESSGGRRPSLVEFEPDAAYILAADVGGIQTTVALANLNGQILARVTARTPHQSRMAVVDGIADEVRAVVAEAGVDPAKVCGMTVGIPGIVHHELGTVELARNLPDFVNVPLAELLGERCGCPVWVENGGNLAAVGEKWQGVARGVQDLIWINLGTGIGAGLIMQGELYRGAANYAGEIGWAPTDRDLLRQDFGNRGALESEVGATGLLRQARGLPGLGEPDNVNEIFAAAEQGHPGALKIVQQAVEHLAVAIATMVALLNPAMIVLGGRQTVAGDLILSPLRGLVRAHVPSMPEIVFSQLGTDAVLVGALAVTTRYGIERLLSEEVARP